MKTKHITCAILCIIMVFALLPATALAAEDISSTGLDLTTSAPTVKTTYTAGSGTVTWDPTVSPATLTFDGATIEVSLPTGNPNPAVAITLPERDGGVNVVFKGTNSITVNNSEHACVLDCTGSTTVTLLPDSDTTLHANSGSMYSAKGINTSGVVADTLEITGSGRLTVKTTGIIVGSYAIYGGEGATSHPVALTGGTLSLAGNVTGNITLGGVTVPSGNNLSLQNAESVTKGVAGAVINGELHLKDGTTLESINGLGLTGSGKVNAGASKQYINMDDEWVAYDDDDFFDGLDLTTAPTVKTAYKAGDGWVVWNPTVSGDPAAVTAGTLTLDSAQIKLGGDGITDSFFQLPNVPVKIELKGTNTFSTSDGVTGTGTVPNSANFFVSANSVELSGSGSIDSTTGGQFISANGGVTLNGGTHKGQIKAPSAVLNNITIPELSTLDLEAVSGSVTATDTVNNGTLVLKRKADTNADIAAIKALNLTGSGYVKAVDGTSNYYANDGSVLSAIGGALDFSKSPEIGNWSDSATVEDNGYEFSGDSTDGYTLKLGNLIMESSILEACITLPGDGSVQVNLVDGTTTRIFNIGSGKAISFLKTGEVAHPCTITGNGKLLLTNYSIEACLKTSQPLTVAGGDITINNYVNTGIFADNTDLTISGGKLKIAAKNSAVNANSLTLKGMVITDPAGAAFDSANKRISDADSNAAANVTIERSNPIPQVTVYNNTQQPKATILLTGAGLRSDDLLVTKRNPSGSAYRALLRLADSSDVFATYNISLRSGQKSTGSAMNLTFDLNAKYAGQDFTLVHRKADSTYEYFYDASDANGDLSFGPLYELSPFMLVKGRLAAGNNGSPVLGDSALPVLWLIIALAMAAAALAFLILYKRQRD